MAGYIVEARNVHKTYHMGKTMVEALRGVDLQIEQGEMVSIMGTSGCGKTTLLNCLSGLDDVSQGEVIIGGTPLNTMTDYQRTWYRGRYMGFVFQAYNLLPVLTAMENVQLPLLIVGESMGTSKTRAMDMLRWVGLEEWGDHKPAELSAGQQQRVAIARSLINAPLIVWADEPTGNLDTETSKEIMKLLRYLNETNKQTFVVVTHDPAVAGMTSRVLKMIDGKIVSG
jgi:putative ABC transport system ATP-binding protein